MSRLEMSRLKCCMIGHAGVGKTSMCHAFMDKSVENIQSTMGIDFLSKTIFINDSSVHLSLWDTAGAEKYDSLMHSYIRDSHIVLIVYDVSDSQLTILKWIRVAAQYNPLVVGIIGNKNDLTTAQHEFTDILAPWERHNWTIVSATCSSRKPSSVKKIILQCVAKAINKGQVDNNKHGACQLKYVNIQHAGRKQTCCT